MARSTQGPVDHRVKNENKPHSVTFGFTSDCSETVGAFEACDNSGAKFGMKLLINSCLAFWKMDGSLGNARDEAYSGPRRVSEEV